MKLRSLPLLVLFSALCLATPNLAQNGEGEGGSGGGGGGDADAPADAPAGDKEETGPRAFWQGRMNGGHFMVRLNSIASIAKHEYISDGAARVVEVTVATNSSVAARFYYLEPISKSMPDAPAQQTLEQLENAARKVAERTGNEKILDSVVKNYPTTTHAHTVEFRLSTEGDVSSLYKSLHNTLETGRGRIWNER